VTLDRTLVVVIALSLCSGALAQTESAPCVVEHPRGENGATINATMSLINDGTPCVMRMRLGGHPATSLTVRGRPASGTLSVSGASVAYTPNPGFSGKDSFDVQWFGVGFGPNSRSHNLRTKVDVTVRVASDEPDAMGEASQEKSAKPGM
jgi:hypothetical protein